MMASVHRPRPAAAPGRGHRGRRGPARGVGIDAVGPYRIGHPGPGGLIFGYATVSEQAIAEGIARFARAIGEL
jgi:hypothetical protein